MYKEILTAGMSDIMRKCFINYISEESIVKHMNIFNCSRSYARQQIYDFMNDGGYNKNIIKKWLISEDNNKKRLLPKYLKNHFITERDKALQSPEVNDKINKYFEEQLREDTI